MYTLLLLLICLTIIILIFIPFNHRSVKIIFYVFWVIFICVSAFRPSKFDRDYVTYRDAFLFKESSYELSFILISKTIQATFGKVPELLFLVYGIIGVSLKYSAIKQISEYLLLSVFIYLCYLYNLQELTGIRVGIACGFILLSIKPLHEKKTIKFLIYILLAIFFHITAIISLIFLLLDTNRINKLFWCIPIPMAYFLHYSNFNIFNTDFLQILTFSDYAGAKANSYSQENGNINIFNSWQILRIFVSYIFIYYSDQISNKNVYFIILLKIYIISTCILPLFNFSSTFSGRISDIFMISDIILIPMISYLMSSKLISKFLIILYGVAYLYLNIFFSKIFTF